MMSNSKTVFSSTVNDDLKVVDVNEPSDSRAINKGDKVSKSKKELIVSPEVLWKATKSASKEAFKGIKSGEINALNYKETSVKKLFGPSKAPILDDIKRKTPDQYDTVVDQLGNLAFDEKKVDTDTSSGPRQYDSKQYKKYRDAMSTIDLIDKNRRLYESQKSVPRDYNTEEILYVGSIEKLAELNDPVEINNLLDTLEDDPILLTRVSKNLVRPLVFNSQLALLNRVIDIIGVSSVYTILPNVLNRILTFYKRRDYSSDDNPIETNHSGYLDDILSRLKEDYQLINRHDEKVLNFSIFNTISEEAKQVIYSDPEMIGKLEPAILAAMISSIKPVKETLIKNYPYSNLS